MMITPPIEKTLIFKYKKLVNEKTNKIVKYPAAHVILQNGEESLETVAVVDSGSDVTFLSEEIAEVLKLKLGKESSADVIGGKEIKTRESKVVITLAEGLKRVPLGSIPVEVGIGIKEKEDDMGILLGRNPIFDLFKITFEQYNNRIIFGKIALKWRPY